MPTMILQVRDIDAKVVDVLKARAAAQGVSLSAFLRTLLAREAAQPPIEEVMARIGSREPIPVSSEVVRSLIEEGRR